MKKVIYIDGGAGRAIAALPALEKLVKNKKPDDDIKLIVMGWDNLYWGNQLLQDITFSADTKGIFDLVVKDADKYISPEPYKLPEYYNQKVSLAEAFDIEINGTHDHSDLPSLKMHTSKAEEKNAANLIADVKMQQKKDKTLIIQPYGRSARVDRADIIDDSSRLASQKAGMPVEIDEDELNDYIDQQISRAQQVNNTTKEEILAAILIAQSLQEDEDKSGMLKAALAAIFLNLLAKRRRMIAEHEAQAAYNAGTFFASRLLGAPSKTWVTRKDAKVRPEHILMQGNTVDVGENFVVDGVKMRFPGDPSAPAHLTINCRCRLKFDIL